MLHVQVKRRHPASTPARLVSFAWSVGRAGTAAVGVMWRTQQVCSLPVTESGEIAKPGGGRGVDRTQLPSNSLLTCVSSKDAIRAQRRNLRLCFISCLFTGQRLTIHEEIWCGYRGRGGE
ncbi:hypothetical protein E2C01_013867 [Portunus trituberculatus]|uniref:Uncharacterized protein n=1 Tax=Portunus trituberculatus TaxID=210409 RepID=A0A5B7DII0_PORTR|nr:hypothetical protein [Portunus trituberculatus]